MALKTIILKLSYDVRSGWNLADLENFYDIPLCMKSWNACFNSVCGKYLLIIYCANIIVYKNIMLLDQKTLVDNCISALDSNKDNMVDVLVGKLIFLGPSMQGKTVTRLRLTKTIKNISSSAYDQSNTGVCEQNTVVFGRYVEHATTIMRNDDWIPIDIEDESQICLNVSNEVSKSPSCTATEPKQEMPQSSTTSSHSSTPVSNNPSQPMLIDMEPEDRKVALEEDIASITSSEMSLEDFDSSDDNIRYILEDKLEYKLEKLKENLREGCLLYMQDTGGQPELMDCLPALTIGPACYLLFCKLNVDLNDHYLVGYRDSDGSTPPCQSHFTIKETLLSALASVASMGYSATDHVKDINQLVRNREGCVYIIGTHKDEADISVIGDFESELKSILLNTFFYKEGLIKWWCNEEDQPTVSHLVYPLDNMNGDDQEIQCLRKSINKKLECFTTKKIPCHWLLFSILLRRQKHAVVSLQSCFSLGKKLRMDEDETKLTLHFLHYNLGICMHFSNVPELNNKVITDTQSVYKSLTTLIESAFKPGLVNKADADEFKMTGMFSVERFEGPSDNNISLKTLIYILDHLNIVAPIHSPNQEKKLYFMPCILPNIPERDLALYEEHHSRFPSPLYIRYKCGFVPIGVFSAMIANIIHLASQKVC